MEFFAPILGLLAILSLTTALPTITPSPRSADKACSVVVTLRGATPEATYSVDVPLSAPWVTSTNTAPYDPHHLGISYVSYDHSIARCYFFGDDERSCPPVEVNGQLGPPQSIGAIWCESL